MTTSREVAELLIEDMLSGPGTTQMTPEEKDRITRNARDLISELVRYTRKQDMYADIVEHLDITKDERLEINELVKDKIGFDPHF